MGSRPLRLSPPEFTSVVHLFFLDTQILSNPENPFDENSESTSRNEVIEKCLTLFFFTVSNATKRFLFYCKKEKASMRAST